MRVIVTGAIAAQHRFDRSNLRVAGRRALRSPWSVGVFIFILYGLWLLGVFSSGQQPRDLIHISPELISQSKVSSAIKVDPNYRTDSASGYDGQFFYYLALDPVNAHYYMDASTYRYTRILYPLVARTLALGRPDLIPITLCVVNWLALAGGTLAIAAWLRRRGLSPWFALLYGLYPGLLFSLARDLSEVLAYGLVALAILIFDGKARHRILLSAIVFAMASLTRETAAVFGVAFGLLLFLQHRRLDVSWRRHILDRLPTVVPFLTVALAPIVLYKAFLVLWLGSQHDAGVTAFAPLPFAGLWHWRHELESLPLMRQINSIVIPGLLAAAGALLVLLRGSRSHLFPALKAQAQQGMAGATLGPWLLIANIVLFVIFLQWASYADYGASGRITTGVILSALLCLPVITALQQRAWFWACTALWLLPLPYYLLLPAVHNYAYLLHLLRRS